MEPTTALLNIYSNNPYTVLDKGLSRGGLSDGWYSAYALKHHLLSYVWFRDLKG